MSIFGSSSPKIVVLSSGLEIPLDEAKVDYSFFNPDVIEHVSVLTGFRSYPYSRNQSSFNIDVNLCNLSYSASNALFSNLYQNINEAFTVYPHSDGNASLDVYQVPIQYYITEFEPYYLGNDEHYDAVSITFSPRKNSILFPIDVTRGYGYAYSLNYGVGL